MLLLCPFTDEETEVVSGSRTGPESWPCMAGLGLGVQGCTPRQGAGASDCACRVQMERRCSYLPLSLTSSQEQGPYLPGSTVRAEVGIASLALRPLRTGHPLGLGAAAAVMPVPG